MVSSKRKALCGVQQARATRYVVCRTVNTPPGDAIFDLEQIPRLQAQSMLPHRLRRSVGG